jgi:hypothetical protein
MNALMLDEAAVATLRQAAGLVEIRDASGTVVGFFAPVSLDCAARYAQAAAAIDPLEVQRRKEAGGKTYTTQEALALIGMR